MCCIYLRNKFTIYRKCYFESSLSHWHLCQRWRREVLRWRRCRFICRCGYFFVANSLFSVNEKPNRLCCETAMRALHQGKWEGGYISSLYSTFGDWNGSCRQRLQHLQRPQATSKSVHWLGNGSSPLRFWSWSCSCNLSSSWSWSGWSGLLLRSCKLLMVINAAVSAANSTPACPPLTYPGLITPLTALLAYSTVFVVIGAQNNACSVLRPKGVFGYRIRIWIHIESCSFSLNLKGDSMWIQIQIL